MKNSLDRGILALIILLIGIFIGAVAHEHDLANNFKTYGDAHSWFFEIEDQPPLIINRLFFGEIGEVKH